MINNYLKLDFGSEPQKLEDKFYELATYLMNELCLSVAGKRYKITELEIYCNDKKEHNDPFIHGSVEQLSCGKWYFHGSGLDITFGDAERGIHAGILIRGIVEWGTNKYINGPLNVLKEIFFNMGDVFIDKGGFCLQALTPEEKQAIEKPIRTTRYGLNAKKDNDKNFLEKEYRYITDLYPKHKFNGKEKIVRNLLLANKITNDEAKAILGNNIKKIS